MNRRDATTILVMSAIAEGNHDDAREELAKLPVDELREIVASSMMLNYMANQAIDDRPRDLKDEARRPFAEGGKVDPQIQARPFLHIELPKETIKALEEMRARATETIVSRIKKQ